MVDVEKSIDKIDSRNRSDTCKEGILYDSSVVSAVWNCGTKAGPWIYDPCVNVCYHNYTLHYRLESNFPPEFAFPIYGVTFPILLIFLVIANVFVVLVLSKKHMASPTNTVLLYMAISEFFVGLVPFPFTFFFYTLGYYKRPYSTQIWWCYMSHYLVSVLPAVCHGIAIWLTVLLAAQRYIYIEYPVAAQKWCTIPHVKHAAFILTVLSILSGLLKTLEVNYIVFDGYMAELVPINATDAATDSVQIVRQAFCAGKRTSVVSKMGVNVFYNIYMWTRVIGFLLLPSILLIILNVLLIMGLRTAQERRNRLLKENRQREANRQKDSNSTNLMLIFIVSIFLLVNLPQAIFLAILSFDSTFDLNIPFFNDTNNYANLFVMIDNMLLMATFPVNFAIYCSMSTQFRETFKRIFCHSLPPMPTRQGSVMITNNASYSRLPLNGTKLPARFSKRKQPHSTHVGSTTTGRSVTKYGTATESVIDGNKITGGQTTTVITNPQQQKQPNTLTNGALKLVDVDANSEDDLL